MTAIQGFWHFSCFVCNQPDRGTSSPYLRLFITRYYAIDLAEATGNMTVDLCLINLFSFYLVATQAHMLGFLSHRLEEQLGWTNRGMRT